MKKIVLCTLWAVVSTVTSLAQTPTSNRSALEQLSISPDRSKITDAQGSPYIDENFLSLKISGYDNHIYKGRYNAYNGEMEVDLGTKIIALDNTKTYEVTFTQTNKVYKTYSYQAENGNSKNGFLVIVDETEVHSLLKEELITYHDFVPAATSYHKDKPARFSKENDTYYISKKDIITHLPTNKKKLLKVFSKDAKALKDYIKKNNLSTKDEVDLIQIAAFIGAQ